MKTNNMLNQINQNLLKVAWASGNPVNIESALYIAVKSSPELVAIVDKVALRLSNDKLDLMLENRRKEIKKVHRIVEPR